MVYRNGLIVSPAMLNVLIVPQSSPFHEKRGWARVFPNGVESLRRAVPSGSSDLPQKSSYAQSPSTARGRRMGANEGGAAWSARHGCRRPQSSPANRLRRGAGMHPPNPNPKHDRLKKKNNKHCSVYSLADQSPAGESRMLHLGTNKQNRWTASCYCVVIYILTPS